jgi:hypothetical protein
MTTSADDLMEGRFAVVDGVTYQVDVWRRDELSVWRGANDISGSWKPDMSRSPVIEKVPCSQASRIFAVRVFARWGDVGVRVVRRPRGQATAFYIPSDLATCGPEDWPTAARSRTPPRPGMSSLKSHGSDPDDEFAGDVWPGQLTDIRRTEYDLTRDEDGNLRYVGGLFV